MSHLPGLSHFKNTKATLCNEDMSVLYPKACPGSHRSRALALWLPQCRGDLPSNIPHTTPSSRFKNRTVQYSTFIRLYWYTSREFRTRFARLMPCTIPSDSPAINFVSKRPWQTFLQTAIKEVDVDVYACRSSLRDIEALSPSPTQLCGTWIILRRSRGKSHSLCRSARKVTA